MITQADRLGVNADEFKGSQTGAYNSDHSWVTIHEALNWPAEHVDPNGRGVFARFTGLGDVWVVLDFSETPRFSA